MQRQNRDIDDTRQPDSSTTTARGPCLEALAVLEVFVATLFVVGLFDAASQPLSWVSAMQFLLCATLGMVLWLTDRQWFNRSSCPFPNPNRRTTDSAYRDRGDCCLSAQDRGG